MVFIGNQKLISLLLGPSHSTVMCPSKKTVASAVIKVNCFLNSCSINKMLNNRIMQVKKAVENLLIHLV